MHVGWRKIEIQACPVKGKGRAELPDYVEALRIASSPPLMRSAGTVARGPRGKAGMRPAALTRGHLGLG